MSFKMVYTTLWGVLRRHPVILPVMHASSCEPFPRPPPQYPPSCPSEPGLLLECIALNLLPELKLDPRCMRLVAEQPAGPGCE